MNTNSIMRAAPLALVLLLACSDDGGDDDVDVVYYSDADELTVETADAMDWGSSMAYVPTDPFEDPDQAALLAADNAAMYFTPEGCASAEQSDAELSYELNDCLGPSGHLIEGAIRVTFSDQDDGIGFALASDELQIDGRSVELTIDGVYRAGGSGKSVLYTSEQRLDAQPDELRGSFETELTWTPGSTCLTRDATGQLGRGDLTWAAEVDGYERCAGECPTSGTVMVSDGDGAAVLTFDGSNTATLARQDGNVDSVELDCQP
jgi:hypothetical protein